MIEYKSQTFTLCLKGWIVLTLLFRPYSFYLTLNYFTFLPFFIALVVSILMFKKHRYLIPWIRGWAIVEIVAGVLAIIHALSGYLIDLSPVSIIGNTEYLIAGVLSIAIGCAFYFQTPKFVVLKDTPVVFPENFSELVEKLRIKK